jgi:hypothetical protein
MIVAREQYADLIARAFDGAIVVDGQRVVAHKSGMHVVRAPVTAIAAPQVERVVDRDRDRDNDWSDV